MKMTLKKLRETDESKLPDSDHPFKKDITVEEFRAIINESAEQVRNVKPLKPRTDEDWHITKEQILKAMNNSKDPC
jgi:hypothetical protein